MHTIKAEIADIFSSVQGEGIFTGAKQIFIRFGRCNLSCRFCDEPQDAPGKEYSPAQLMAAVKSLEASKGPHHSVSLTGGEPLLYTDFLKIFLKALKREKFKSYLETNGTLPDALAEVIDLVDIIAMDFKLPSSTGGNAFWDEHLEFLKIAIKKKVFVKAIVTPDTTRHDIEKAVQMVKRLKSNIPLIIQPATPVHPHDKRVENATLLNFLEIGLKNNFDNIKIMPQTHKILNVK